MDAKFEHFYQNVMKALHRQVVEEDPELSICLAEIENGIRDYSITDPVRQAVEETLTLLS